MQYHASYSTIVNAVNYLLSQTSKKHTLHVYSFSGGLGAAHLEHLWCAAPATNCRKVPGLLRLADTAFHVLMSSGIIAQ